MHGALRHCTTLRFDSLSFVDYLAAMPEMIHSTDSFPWKFDEAKEIEWKGLTNKVTWNIVGREEIPKISDVLNGLFLLAVKA